MTDTTGVTPRRSPLWMRVVLGVSLALNLAVAGLVVGAALRVFGHGGPPHPPETFGGSVYRAMEPDDRREMSARLRRAIGPRTGRHADAARLAQTLRADPYDPAALVAILTVQSTTRQGWRDALQTAWLEQIDAMSLAERQAYADRLEAEEQRRKDRHRKKDRTSGRDQDR